MEIVVAIVLVAFVCLNAFQIPWLPGYTLSLLIWAIPIAAMTLYLNRRRLLSREVRLALGIGLSTIAVAGSALDLLFARYFFRFDAPGATLGIRIRGVPLEEFGFYVLGGWFLTLSYVFCDEFWLKRYNRSVSDYRRWARRIPRAFLPSRGGWLAVLAAIVLGIVFKAWRNPQGMPVPGYYLFLLSVAYVPFFLFRKVVGRFVNWRAYAMMLSVTLGTSILWEVTLALPRGWWGYRDGAMLGIFIEPWGHLPLEAVTVWIFCSIVVLVYEAVKVMLYRGAQA